MPVHSKVGVVLDERLEASLEVEGDALNHAGVLSGRAEGHRVARHAGLRIRPNIRQHHAPTLHERTDGAVPEAHDARHLRQAPHPTEVIGARVAALRVLRGITTAGGSSQCGSTAATSVCSVKWTFAIMPGNRTGRDSGTTGRRFDIRRDWPFADSNAIAVPRSEYRGFTGDAFMELPARFGKYEPSVAREGGMAEIFLARSFGVEGFERHLVVKRILPDLASSARFVGLFIKEAKISASLSHPNIVQIYELGRVGTDHYIAMEFIHGRDLTRINKSMRSEGERIPIPLAVYIVASILRGLHHAHSRTDAQGRTMNLIHRDVSPHNVMIGFTGGQALRLWHCEVGRGLGSDRGNAGRRIRYMSPEQAAGRAMTVARCLQRWCGAVRVVGWASTLSDPDPAEKLRRCAPLRSRTRG